MYIDQCCSRLSKNFSKNKVIVFCVIFVVGLIANLGLITNQVTNPDGILATEYTRDLPWLIATGRWAISFVYKIRGDIVLPALTTVFVVFLYSAATILILELLDIRGNIFSVLIGCALISFPTITQYTSYFYMAEAFAVGQLLAVLSVWILQQEKYNKYLSYAIAVCLLVIATSFFQAMIGVAAALCMLILMREVKIEKNSLKQILVKIIRFLTYGVFSFGGYYIIAKGVCWFSGIQMSDYRGISSAFRLDFQTILPAVKNAYRTFFAFYFTDQYYAYPFWDLNIAFFVLLFAWIAVEAAWILKSIRTRETAARGGLLTALLLLFPLACILIGIVANDTYIDFKMIPQMMFPIGASVSCIEKVRLTFKTKKLHIIAALLMCFLVTRNVVMSNAITEAMKIKADAARSFSTRVLVMLQNNAYYDEKASIAILGNCEDEKWLRDTAEYWRRVRADTALWGQFWSSEYNTTQASWYSYFRRYHGLSLTMVDDNTAALLLNTSEFEKMPVFPEEGCIQVIEGVLTVKISDFQ